MPVFEPSKRMTWKLKGLYLRPETADRLRSYVNRLQEDDKKIDASDVVDQALTAFLEPDRSVYSVGGQVSVLPSHGPVWGNWRFNPDNLTLVWRKWYDIDLEQINSSAKMLDWIFQCLKGQRGQQAEDMKDLLKAFGDIFNPQRNCCSWGQSMSFSGSELAKAYRQEMFPERFSEKKKRKQIPSKLRYSILERDGFRCKACGISADDGATLHVDHRIAVANGGTNDPDNLQVLCSDCNLGKGAR